MVGLVMSYRLAPGVQHPEQVRDVASECCRASFEFRLALCARYESDGFIEAFTESNTHPPCVEIGTRGMS